MGARVCNGSCRICNNGPTAARWALPCQSLRGSETRRRRMAEVDTSREGAVLTITLNRPDVLNALNAALHRALAGAGLSLDCECDLRLAAVGATFVPAFINIGLVPDSGGTYFVRRLLGTARAFEWLATGRRLTAPEAHAWGLVSEVVEGDSLAARAAELAAELAALQTRGVALTKRLLDHAEHTTLEEQLELEAQLQAAATQTADFREGVAAFLEKREPRFEGA